MKETERGSWIWTEQTVDGLHVWAGKHRISDANVEVRACSIQGEPEEWGYAFQTERGSVETVFYSRHRRQTAEEAMDEVENLFDNEGELVEEDAVLAVSHHIETILPLTGKRAKPNVHATVIFRRLPLIGSRSPTIIKINWRSGVLRDKRTFDRWASFRLPTMEHLKCVLKYLDRQVRANSNYPMREWFDYEWYLDRENTIQTALAISQDSFIVDLGHQLTIPKEMWEEWFLLKPKEMLVSP